MLTKDERTQRITRLCRLFLRETADISSVAAQYPGGMVGLLEDRADVAALFAATYSDEHTADATGVPVSPRRRSSRHARRGFLRSLPTRADPGSPHEDALVRCP